MTNARLMLRFVGSVMLLAGILVFAWNGTSKVSQRSGERSAQDVSSPAFIWKNLFGKGQADSTAGLRGEAPITVQVHGHFLPDDEHVLIEQLTREGYIYLSAYRLDTDGNAVIAGINRYFSVQPIVTITVDKNGSATATSQRI